MKVIEWIAVILLIIGGLNWGLVGALNFNVVTWLVGAGLIANTIYIVVGVAALVEIYALTQM